MKNSVLTDKTILFFIIILAICYPLAQIEMYITAYISIYIIDPLWFSTIDKIEYLSQNIYIRHSLNLIRCFTGEISKLPLFYITSALVFMFFRRSIARKYHFIYSIIAISIYYIFRSIYTPGYFLFMGGTYQIMFYERKEPLYILIYNLCNDIVLNILLFIMAVFVFYYGAKTSIKIFSGATDSKKNLRSDVDIDNLNNRK